MRRSRPESSGANGRTFSLPPLISQKILDRPASREGGVSNSTRLLCMHQTKPPTLWKWKELPCSFSSPSMLTRPRIRTIGLPADNNLPLSSSRASLSKSSSPAANPTEPPKEEPQVDGQSLFEVLLLLIVAQSLNSFVSLEYYHQPDMV